jgi:hypothetical protein
VGATRHFQSRDLRRATVDPCTISRFNRPEDRGNVQPVRKRPGQGKYPYFSNSRTGAYLSDHEITIPQTAYTVTSPSFSGLPAVSRTRTATGSPSRATIARLIEKDLASGAVTRFNAPPKIHYAKGTSQLIFGEYRTVSEVQSGKPALIWTAADYDNDERHSVAICLSGSMSRPSPARGERQLTLSRRQSRGDSPYALRNRWLKCVKLVNPH